MESGAMTNNVNTKNIRAYGSRPSRRPQLLIWKFAVFHDGATRANRFSSVLAGTVSERSRYHGDQRPPAAEEIDDLS